MVARPLVLKFGGELLEIARTWPVSCARSRRSSPRARRSSSSRRRQGDRRRAEGRRPRETSGGRPRITDEATLDVVVSVLAGAVNTRFVAALNTAAVAAVGLTGRTARAVVNRVTAAPCGGRADRRFGASRRAGGRRRHAAVPDADRRAVRCRFSPPSASAGRPAVQRNADTFAGHLAARLGAGGSSRRHDAGGARCRRCDAADSVGRRGRAAGERRDATAG